MNRTQSSLWHARAETVILGGVNSPSRSFYAVGGGSPVVMATATGSRFVDVDGNSYIDYLGAFGPLVLGHAHPHVMAAIRSATEDGILYGTPTRWEVEFAERLRQAIPQLERVRFMNSGTEAVMTTIRIARAVTGRTKLIKFAGCYHGHSDAMLVAAGSGPSSMGVPDSAGVTAPVASDVITVPYNDIPALDAALLHHNNQVAAVLVEPIVGNFGIVPPSNHDYLREVIQLAHHHGALAIFDEVITAFRFHYGSAAQMYGVEPDLFALGKIIGGGLPIGAYGGKQALMEQVAPLGPVYQAGTMAGNPASMRAGLACLEVLRDESIYRRIERLGAQLEAGILASAADAGVPVTINRVGGAFAIYFGAHPVHNYEDAKQSDDAQFSALFHELLNRGIYTAPSKFEAWFVSAAHSESDVEETLSAVQQSFRAMVRG